MKQKVKLCALIAICSLSITRIDAQFEEMTPVDMPGDHFSLEGALSVFQDSKSPEDFEKRLNAEKQIVNNIDLNADGETDYIHVVDYTNDDNHALVLQISVSADESQDIAIIEIEKTGTNEAILQIIGDDDIWVHENCGVLEYTPDGGSHGNHVRSPLMLGMVDSGPIVFIRSKFTELSMLIDFMCPKEDSRQSLKNALVNQYLRLPECKSLVVLR